MNMEPNEFTDSPSDYVNKTIARGFEAIKDRVAALEECYGRISVYRDFDNRIAALAQRIDDWISADVTSSSEWEQRIAAIEMWAKGEKEISEDTRHVWHEQEDHLIDLCAEHENRIAALEDKIGPEFVKLIDAAVKEIIVLKDFTEERIAALEAKIK